MVFNISINFVVNTKEKVVSDVTRTFILLDILYYYSMCIWLYSLNLEPKFISSNRLTDVYYINIVEVLIHTHRRIGCDSLHVCI